MKDKIIVGLLGLLAGVVLCSAGLTYYNLSRQEALYERVEAILCRMEDDGRIENGICVPRFRPHNPP